MTSPATNSATNLCLSKNEAEYLYSKIVYVWCLVNRFHWYSADGGTQYKRPNGDVPPTWVAKSASSYMNDLLKMQNLKVNPYKYQFFTIKDTFIYQILGQIFSKMAHLFQNYGSNLGKFQKSESFCLKFGPIFGI